MIKMAKAKLEGGGQGETNEDPSKQSKAVILSFDKQLIKKG